ncbi:DNA topoisomerase 3-alpha [Euroglyphus maynei]|uniref:DNA topoisomerase n=1 Tax=Euroglyphus maynei TaxID=6958 RepID=A0A1Y3BTH9_EURMA|nr:DNA topoisomerase 3-alpha [Euroglyphus maynei]
MVKVLNVAEKNDVAKNVANILSRGSSRRREGYSKFNKIYEFQIQLPALRNQQCQMIMTSVSGHLLNYDFSGDYGKWNGCDPRVLFSAPIITTCSDQCKLIKRTIEREIRNCTALIIWTDCDREGENIGFEIVKICQAIKPDIRVLRAHFSEITSPAIYRAINSLTDPDKKISDAVDIRQQLDLRIGAAFTRFLTLGLQRIVPNLEKCIISYGSCQFPTLGFVVERWKEREEFQPQPFWFIEVNVKRDDINCTFTWNKRRLFDQRACAAIMTKIMENPQAKVIRVNNRRTNKYRPQPMDTVTFERLASSKLKINAKRAMVAAERLYTLGFISYPRTETNKFPPEIKLNDLIQAQCENRQWGQYASRILEQGGANPRNGNKSDQAHPPIHPTKPASNLSDEEQRKVYELITRHFLACCWADAIGAEETVDIEINDEIFHAKGLRIIEKNYLEVYKYDFWSEKQLPQFVQDECFNPNSIMMKDGRTTAPELLTESDLIALMEKFGIGTDATHAEHIEKIKDRKYISQTEDRRLKPEGLGIGIYEAYMEIEEEMTQPFLRAQLERELQQICNGEKNPQEILRNQLILYEKVYHESFQNRNRLFQKIIEFI